ncbi:MAG: hypothetical protein H7Z14_04245 [Anaerolineae bacterium]|nr:hypothetical protein [Phycisphaerae bacterium]
MGYAASQPGEPFAKLSAEDRHFVDAWDRAEDEPIDQADVAVFEKAFGQNWPDLRKRRPLVNDPHLVHILKWPIMLLLMCTSLPAGFLSIAIGSVYDEYRRADSVTTRWRNQYTIDSSRETFETACMVLLGALAVHAIMVALSIRKWNVTLLGMRGAVWFVLSWAAFVTGAALALWVLPK